MSIAIVFTSILLVDTQTHLNWLKDPKSLDQLFPSSLALKGAPQQPSPTYTVPKLSSLSKPSSQLVPEAQGLIGQVVFTV